MATYTHTYINAKIVHKKFKKKRKKKLIILMSHIKLRVFAIKIISARSWSPANIQSMWHIH